MTQQTTINQTQHTKHAESILVVPRSAIIGDQSWYGIKQVDCDSYLELITKHQEFRPRYQMETDEQYKQIIPYLIFKHHDTYFVMQRAAGAGESRLASKFTLGIGGHIRHEDMSHNSIISWAQREFHEEVDYTGNLRIEPIGILNDDTSAVGRVHLGFIFLLHADSPAIQIKSELQGGTLITLEECIALKDRMETWSALVVDYLSDQKKA
jgi:predicted NUDIX family phosphoesterase